MSYPITIVKRARVLREAGWSLRRISALIERETGRRPSINTVAYWTDADYEARKLAKNLRRHRAASGRGAGAGARLGCHRHTPEFRLARVAALRAFGVDVRSVALVMAFDYGEELALSEVAALGDEVPKMDRCRELIALPGMGPRPVASLMSVEYGEPITFNQVAYALKVGRWPRPYQSRRSESEASPAGAARSTSSPSESPSTSREEPIRAA